MQVAWQSPPGSERAAGGCGRSGAGRRNLTGMCRWGGGAPGPRPLHQALVSTRSPGRGSAVPAPVRGALATATSAGRSSRSAIT